MRWARLRINRLLILGREEGIRHIDLFSGIAGFALAAKRTWGKDYVNIGHSEIEKFPCKVYHKHFPESECLGDITKIQWQEGQANIITGGFPCQPHSIAGKRKGSTDSRDLWSECVRALRCIRPRFALFENVPGLLTSERGRFFNRVLSDLARVGYNAEWQNIPASDFELPSVRERIWLVAYPAKERWGVFNNTTKAKTGKWQLSAQIESGYRWRRKIGGHSLESVGWVVEPDIRGGCDGIPSRLDKDRIAGLGNAIVPQVAEMIMKQIKHFEEHR